MHESIQIRFGRAVRGQRLRVGLSQEQLARESGLQRTYICDVERGSRNPSLRNMQRIADALGVPLGVLFS